MDGTPHCNFKIYRDATKGVPVLKTLDGKYVSFLKWQINFYGKNDDAMVLGLNQTTTVAITFAIKKW
jgi:hypothetical protein